MKPGSSVILRNCSWLMANLSTLVQRSAYASDPAPRRRRSLRPAPSPIGGRPDWPESCHSGPNAPAFVLTPGDIRHKVVHRIRQAATSRPAASRFETASLSGHCSRRIRESDDGAWCETLVAFAPRTRDYRHVMQHRPIRLTRLGVQRNAGLAKKRFLTLKSSLSTPLDM